MIDDEPYVIVNHLIVIQYADFLERTLSLLLKDVPLNIRKDMWFQHHRPVPLPTFHAKCIVGRTTVFQILVCFRDSIQHCFEVCMLAGGTFLSKSYIELWG
jgi:hypothetical protein